MEEQRIFASFINVLPFEIRSLKIGHTVQRRTQRFYVLSPLCVPFICSRLTLSLHISEEPTLVIDNVKLFIYVFRAKLEFYRTLTT